MLSEAGGTYEARMDCRWREQGATEWIAGAWRSGPARTALYWRRGAARGVGRTHAACDPARHKGKRARVKRRAITIFFGAQPADNTCLKVEILPGVDYTRFCIFLDHSI